MQLLYVPLEEASDQIHLKKTYCGTLFYTAPQGVKVLVMYVLVYLELDPEFRSTPSNATLKHRVLIPNAHG